MTTSDYLESLQNDLTTIKQHLSDGGMEISEGDNFSDLATKTDGIQIGGGGSGLDWTALGYNGTPESLEETYNFSLNFKNTWVVGTSMYNKFNNKSTIVFMPLVDTSQTYSFYGAFYGATSLIEVPALVISNQVTTTQNMFNNCSSLMKVDTSNYDMSNVTQMNAMFANCKKIEKIDISSFNLEKLTDMQSAFYSSYNLKEIKMPNYPIPIVSNIDSLFNGCSSLKEIDLSMITSPNVTALTTIFVGCNNLKKIDMRNINITSTTRMINTFGTRGNGVPNDCLIIVKNNEAKQIIQTTFTRLTNVQTVEEYESSL